MKITVEIPDQLFREAQAAAALRGIPLKDFLAEALRERLRSKSPAAPRWMQAFGGLRDLHRENKRLDRLIAQEFCSLDS
ncbi:MAG: hypothetical protein HYX25_06075 [Candidatus Solibacter usitatus]|nr:hypothetical protein [Candidatus Solibacter usitatus]